MVTIATTKSTNDRFNLAALLSDQDRSCLFPIHFAYDYMPKGLKYLAAPPPPVVFHNTYQKAIDGARQNSIPLDPTSANLPWHSGLTSLRQNKHWKINLRCTAELLQLFAEDVNLNNARISTGQTFAHFAKRELETRSFDRYSRFATYMFPDADERRSALLAQIILLIVLFDDKWEETAPEHACIAHDQENFIQLIQGKIDSAICETPLQRRIAEVHRGFLDEDSIAGNGGADVIKTLLEFSRHSPPLHDFATVREYLDYRYVDIAMPYSYACAKFSIRSDINLQDTKLHRYLHLMGDHFSIANDLASYDKEKRSFEVGQTKHLINVVAVVQKLVGLSDSDTAKAISYAIQLETEKAISDELERLKVVDELSNAQWKFVDSVLIMAAGNIFTSVVISRYGGEAARLVK